MRTEVEAFLGKSGQKRAEARRQAWDAFLLEQGLHHVASMEEGGDPSDHREFEGGKQCRKIPLELAASGADEKAERGDMRRAGAPYHNNRAAPAAPPCFVNPRYPQKP